MEILCVFVYLYRDNYPFLSYATTFNCTLVSYMKFTYGDTVVGERDLEMETYPRVFSIQSHVVSGYVGNKSASFPLQLLGFDVDAINSVQFSNHTGYGIVKGQILNEKNLADLVEGLAGNNLDNYTHLLTGYIGSSAFLNEIANVVKQLKRKNPNLVYVCDPVMGDNGKLYVPKELLPIYKDVTILLADILTPNQFELELLTDTKITTIEDAWKAVDILHKKGCKVVALSSTELGDHEYLLGLVSSKLGCEDSRFKIHIPRLPATFTGTGDLFACLFLAWTYKTNNDVKLALEKTIATISCVLKRTLDYAKNVGISTKNLELKLIQSKNDIENPEVKIFAQAV